MVPALVPTARVPADDSGARVTSFPSRAPPKPVVVTVTRPFELVTMVATYFVPPVPAVVISQPQPLTTAATLVPLWQSSLIDVRHPLAASITSDIFARML